MIKRGTVLLSVIVFIIILSSLTFAANETTQQTPLDKAINCVKNKVGDDCSKLRLEEQAAALLSVGVIGKDKNCKDSLISNSRDSGECWPSTTCNLKDTALSLLALDKIGQDVTSSKSWLLNQTKTASDLIWYLQIESSSATTCTISYNELKSSVNIGADKKVSSLSSNCFSVSENGYWIKISSNCLENNYIISCDADFLTTLLYKSQTSPTIHVSQNVHSSVNGGETEEKVIYKCFKQAGTCNYEGSLWAAMVLTKQGVDTSPFVPYLDAFADENKKLFPESFLYIITGSQDYLVSILKDNFKTNFWSVGSYGKFYSTSLALLALQASDYSESSAAKEYLLNGKSQNQEGCWNNIRDTGFLIYAAWSDANSLNPDEGHHTLECITNSDCGSNEICTDAGICAEIRKDGCESNEKFCIFGTDSDCEDAGGLIFSELQGCDSGEVCCTVDIVLQTCSQKGGRFCTENEECPVESRVFDISDSYNGDCCLTQCNENPIDQQTECEEYGDVCRTGCLDNEEENSYLCNEDFKCCHITETSTCPAGQQKCSDGSCKSECLTPAGGINWTWIIVLIILIILVALGIIFRNKLMSFFSKSPSVKKGPPVRPTRPPFFPPRPGMRPGMMRSRPFFPQRPMSAPAQRPQISGKDKEYDETLKKLKEMSK